MTIIKKYDNKLKNFVFHCKHNGKACKFIDSSCDTMVKAKELAEWFYNHKCFS